MTESPDVETRRGALKYRGDRTATYDHGTGTGVLGKIVGPNLKGQWFAVVDAQYDAAEDLTYARLVQIQSPLTAFDQAVR